MIEGIIGKKVGMTQIFTDEGKVIPVTIIKAGPCLVVQKKTEKDTEVKKVQLGLVEDKKVKNVNKPMSGHFEKAKVPATKILREFIVESDEVKVGDTVKVVECRPLSKNVTCVVVSTTPSEVTTEE